ncbi:hypothetical protein R1flu_000477 [Riccia fluitans]|uniref:DUF4283 domain-containing protein n=1 Tax=Riccia fluitans TaxID=41844 RepID=A0ABD1Y3I5_9MARC
MIEHGLTKGGQDLEQNVNERVLFVGASTAFRNAHCTSFNALQERPRALQKGRKPLNDISNWPVTQQVKRASTSPLAKRSRPLNYDMELLAQQIATQVANSKAANAYKDTSGHYSRMGPADPLSKGSGHYQFGSQEPKQGQLPKVLFKASSSGVLKDKAPTTENPNNRSHRPTLARRLRVNRKQLTHAQTQGKVVRAFIDAQQLSNQINFLKEKTFVLYTLDISLSRDAILEWADAVLHHKMGITILRVRVLNKHCYLMTVENEHDKDRNLDAAPLFLGPHMVFALPWDPCFDSAKLDNCKVPLWVELPNIHPCLEAFGTQLLQSIGEVLFTSCEETDYRFTSILGCLKLDLSLDLPEAIKIIDLDTEEEPREDEEDEEEPAPLRGNDGGPEEVNQNQLGDETESNPEPQSQKVSPLDQSPGNNSKRQGGKKSASKSAEQGTFAVDYTEEGKAGAALIIRKNWEILAEGRWGDGTAVWMKPRTEIGEIGFASVHGPRDRSNRARLWKWLAEICAEGTWILGGDWNSVETWEDNVGESPIQRGTEQRRWNELAGQLDLADGWIEASSRSGPHFTWERQVGDCFDQARLDRVYY